MIAVIMSTYNGEKYLPQQLDSVLRQTLEDFFAKLAICCGGLS